MTTRLALLAYACRPDIGGEYGVGWQTLLNAGDNFDSVHVYVHAPHRTAIIEGLPAGLRHKVEVIPVSGPAWFKPVPKSFPFHANIYYVLWQREAGKQITKAHSLQQYDLGHHATFGPDWAPSGLACVGDLKWIWGPLGGSSVTPSSLWKYLGFRGTLFEVGRRLAMSLGSRSLAKKSAQSATMIVAQNSDVARHFSWHENVVVEPSPAIDVGTIRRLPGESSEWLCIGRLLPWKGWVIAILALKYLPEEHRLTFYGKGPDQERLEKVIRRHGLDERVTFAGHIERDLLFERLAGCRGIVFPSLHDAAPWTVAEAVTLGVRVVGINLAGVQTVLERAGQTGVPHQSSNLPQAFAEAMSEGNDVEVSDVWTSKDFRLRFSKLYKQLLQA